MDEATSDDVIMRLRAIGKLADRLEAREINVHEALDFAGAWVASGYKVVRGEATPPPAAA